MAPPVTEFAKLTLKPGTDFTPGSDDHKVLYDNIQIVLSAPGCERCYWGQQVEDPSTLWMILDWNTHQAHTDFMNDPGYGAFVKNLTSLLAGAPVLDHIAFEPHPPRHALSDTTSPATEILTMYFPTDTSADQKTKIANNMKSVIDKIIAADPEACKGASFGWLSEDSVSYEKAPGGKATVHRAVIGWSSVEAHHKTRETQVFKDNIHHVREAPGLIGMEVCHINPVEVQQGGA